MTHTLILIIAVMTICSLVFGIAIRLMLAALIVLLIASLGFGVLVGCSPRSQTSTANDAFRAWTQDCDGPIFWEAERDPNNISRQGFIAECMTKEVHGEAARPHHD